MDWGLYTIAILMIAQGVLGIFGIRNPLLNMKKYTEKSVKMWYGPTSVLSVVGGIGLACFNTYIFSGVKNKIFLVAGIIGILLCAIGTLIVNKKYLVRR